MPLLQRFKIWFLLMHIRPWGTDKSHIVPSQGNKANRTCLEPSWQIISSDEESSTFFFTIRIFSCIFHRLSNVDKQFYLQGSSWYTIPWLAKKKNVRHGSNLGIKVFSFYFIFCFVVRYINYLTICTPSNYC